MRIIPAPKDVKKLDGIFVFTKDTALDCEEENIVANFNGFLQKAFGFSLKKGGDVIFSKEEKLPVNDEGYILDVDDKIKISARTDKGLFYGMQSLKQLVFDAFDVNAGKAELQKTVITDEPRFAYRGFMFDCARHFFPVEVIKEYIDAVAMQKMNVFHWHLTEDQGWRVEISAYPNLTKIGSTRRGTMNDNVPHGGFYSKADVAEIVKFAAERYITVVPEFDMPGHTRAALASYPELGCFGKRVEVSTKFGIHKEILCGGRDASYNFIRGVLSEFAQMFPSQFVHLGGDEAIKTEWYACQDCQKKIKELGLRDEEDLQGYMTNTAVKYLKTLDKTAICWNESANSGTLDKSVVLQYWADGKTSANVIREVKNGRKIIVSKFNPYYLDYPYSMFSLKAAYSYEPVFNEIKDYAENVIGVESPIWTEWVDNTDLLAFRVFPRLTAVAETAWSDGKNKDYDSFVAALQNFTKMLRLYNIKSADIKKCNPAAVTRPFITAKFGLKMVDFEMIARSAKANSEMKKMRAKRKGDSK